MIPVSQVKSLQLRRENSWDQVTRTRQGREEAGLELRAPLSVLCVLHQSTPPHPLHPQSVVNSLGGTDLSTIGTDLSKVSVATSP